MTNFESLNLIFDNLVVYWTGNYAILGFFMITFFILLIMSQGIDFRYATVVVLPLVGLFTAIGWFSTLTDGHWILNAFLIMVSLFYAFALLRFTT